MVNDFKFTRVKKKEDVQRLGSLAHVNFYRNEKGRLSVGDQKGIMHIDDMRRKTLRGSANLKTERNVSSARATGRVISHETMHEVLRRRIGARAAADLDNGGGSDVKNGWYNHPRRRKSIFEELVGL